MSIICDYLNRITWHVMLGIVLGMNLSGMARAESVPSHIWTSPNTLTSIKTGGQDGPSIAALELNTLLDSQRELGCNSPQNALQSALCAGEIRIGVRNSYKAFGDLVDGELEGFEIDYANYIADKLGVTPIFVPVTAANRIRKLIDGDIDLILATMAHTPARAEIVSFIQPHYYSSPTAVAGFKKHKVGGIEELDNVALCVPLGSYSNIAFAKAQARTLIFSTPQKMFDALRFGACDLVAHDRSLILAEVTGQMAPASMRANFDEKFSFNEIPWGMAVRHADENTLGKAVALITAEAHGQGVLITLALGQGVHTAYLDQQQSRWSELRCYFPGGGFVPDCLIQPPALGDQPSVISAQVAGVEHWIEEHIDIEITLPMLSGQQGLRLFIGGILTSIILVVGVVTTTLLSGLMFYRLHVSTWSVVRLLNGMVRSVFLYAPVILIIALAYLIVSGIFLYTGTVALSVAIVVIGLDNGAGASEAMLRAKASLPREASLATVASASATQVRAYVINAAKASPLAAFIGTPELLSVLTDITSFSGERVATFTFLAVFYLLVVQLVMSVSAAVVKRLQLSEQAGAHAG